MNDREKRPLAALSINHDNAQGTTVTLSGSLDIAGVSKVWEKAEKALFGTGDLVIDLKRVDHMDSAGAALVWFIKTTWKQRTGGKISVLGLKPAFKQVMDLTETIPDTRDGEKKPKKKPPSFVETRGKNFADQMEKATSFIALVGQITRALIHAFFHPLSVRWKDALLTAERSGVNALPIVALISFIVGLVMAFQAAMPMKMFGAEIYVANLIGIAMVRELGPLMTAIILAGRSGSAFAAEIGTMKINEEIDALSTMGLDPVRFLMVPRILAAVFITPLLTIFSNFVGIMGGSIVLLSMGYPAITYYSQVISFVTWIDFTGGLVKCFVFGILISAAGCIRGIETQSGPGAVGASTTSAVVTGITLIAVFDGIFSVLFYCLGI
ncbi:ABC transporter permease [Desulforapulum autotrophicum]|uniref:ABC transporter permease n=1 Tax=Desulforapulum autotrophicum TaxID=2296 RepID=UPI00059C5369|nr:MlaE family lipid ABC transporter permease subunit [Desulforapulum autotrophicum]